MQLPKLLELEERLSADPEGKIRDELVKELEEARLQASATMRHGRAPEEYRRLAALVDAYTAAQAVVPVVWKRFNSGKKV